MYEYKDLNDVPQSWRQLRNAKLTVEQVNYITKLSEDFPLSDTVPNRGAGNELFQLEHEIHNGTWRKVRTLPPTAFEEIRENAEIFKVEIGEDSYLPNWAKACAIYRTDVLGE